MIGLIIIGFILIAAGLAWSREEFADKTGKHPFAFPGFDFFKHKPSMILSIAGLVLIIIGIII
jgi:uncharacterized membrane protein